MVFLFLSCCPNIPTPHELSKSWCVTDFVKLKKTWPIKGEQHTKQHPERKQQKCSSSMLAQAVQKQNKYIQIHAEREKKNRL